MANHSMSKSIANIAKAGVLFVAILLLVVAAVIAVRHSNNSKVEYRNVKVQLDRNEEEQKKLEEDYKKLEGAKAGSEQKVQELEQKRQQLEKEKQDLEAQLQAKAELKARNLAYAAAAPKVPFTERQSGVVNCGGDPNKAFIYQKESGCNTAAINKSSGACGIGQALPCSKLPCSLSDFACQDAWFSNYAIQRYGSWANARAFWERNHWW